MDKIEKTKRTDTFLCVGGPYKGKKIAHNENSFSVAELNEMGDITAVSHFTYAKRSVNSYIVWADNDIDDDIVAEMLLRSYEMVTSTKF